MNPESAWNRGTMEGMMQNQLLFGNRNSNDDDISYYENEIHFANQVIGDRNVTIQLQNMELQKLSDYISKLEADLMAAGIDAKADHDLMDMDLETSRKKLLRDLDGAARKETTYNASAMDYLIMSPFIVLGWVYKKCKPLGHLIVVAVCIWTLLGIFDVNLSTIDIPRIYERLEKSTYAYIDRSQTSVIKQIKSLF